MIGTENKPRPMRLTSAYEVPCECGRLLVSASSQLVCPDCGRTITIDWPAQLVSMAGRKHD